MCDPIAIALSVGSSLLQYSQQNAMVKAQNDATEQSYRMMLEQTKEQQKQINQASQVEQSERLKQGMIERAQIATIAGESGALGFSSDRLIGDSFMQQAIDIGSMETNRANAIKQSQTEAKAAQVRSKSTINSNMSQAGSLLGTGLQIAGDGYKVYKAASTKAKSKT